MPANLGTPVPPPPPAPFPAGPVKASGPHGWRKFFAIAGIVFAFPFFLTIPGWVALSAYRKWKSGERAQPTGLIAWGVIACVFFLAVVVTAQVSKLAGSTEPTATGPAVAEDPGTSVVPPGFTATSGNDGWTTYASVRDDFSIALPPGWQAIVKGGGGPRAKFNAFDREPTYAPPIQADVPQLLVLRLPAAEGVNARRYYQLVRLQFSQHQDLVGEVDMATVRLPEGRAYVFNADFNGPTGQESTTTYAFLRGTAEYRLAFFLPEAFANQYATEFESIAKTFALAS